MADLTRPDGSTWHDRGSARPVVHWIDGGENILVTRTHDIDVARALVVRDYLEREEIGEDPAEIEHFWQRHLSRPVLTWGRVTPIAPGGEYTWWWESVPAEIESGWRERYFGRSFKGTTPAVEFQA